MAFCSYCGSELPIGARFCSSCGSPADNPAAVVPAPQTAAVPAQTVQTYIPVGDLDYGLVLYSIGTCAKSYADDVLEDILGYTDSEAKQLIKMAPTQIAQSLSMEQAQYIAQALTEYGMQVAIYKGSVPVDLGQHATQSVFNTDGSFLSGVLAAIAAVTVSNRVRTIRRWTLSNIISALFRPKYTVTVPPRHVSRLTYRREPEPIRVTEPRRVTIPRREQQPRRTTFTSSPSRSVQRGRAESPSTFQRGGQPGGGKPGGGPAGGRSGGPGGHGR